MSTLLQALGALLIAVGLAMWLLPVGVIAAGVLLLLFGLSAEIDTRGGQHGSGEPGLDQG